MSTIGAGLLVFPTSPPISGYASDRLWPMVGSPHSAELLLSGEAGVGKTAMLEAAAAQAAAAGTRVLRAAGRSSSHSAVRTQECSLHAGQDPRASELFGEQVLAPNRCVAPTTSSGDYPR